MKDHFICLDRLAGLVPENIFPPLTEVRMLQVNYYAREPS